MERFERKQLGVVQNPIPLSGSNYRWFHPGSVPYKHELPSIKRRKGLGRIPSASKRVGDAFLSGEGKYRKLIIE